MALDFKASCITYIAYPRGNGINGNILCFGRTATWRAGYH
jgi:hypothetical protein